MTPQERELLTGLFDRLKQVERNPKDEEAEAFIAQAMAAQPSAPYFMAQVLLVQDQALSAAQARIRQLQQEIEAARSQPAAPARSFLGDAPALGPWGAHRGTAAPPASPSPASPPPAAGSPASAQAAQSGGSGGFLRGALQTAAGVAGGALLFEGINSLFHHGGPWGGGGSFLPTGGAPTLVEETVINEYGGGAQPEALADASDPGQVWPADDSDPGAPSPASDDFAADDNDRTDADDSDLV
jgi:uncharacterized protein